MPLIKPITYDDIFGYDDAFAYDDAGRPYAVQLHGYAYAYGYEFCRVFKSLFSNGCLATHRLFENPQTAFIFVYEPESKAVEIWQGRWEVDEQNIYSIIEPERLGLLDKTFDGLDALKAFTRSDMGDVQLRAGELPVRSDESN